MTLRATKEKSGHCPRCREDVRSVQPWPHWRKVRYGYFGVLGCALFGSPVLLCDGFVLIPTLMLFMAAIGPLNSLVSKPATCMQCGAPVEALRRLRVIEGEAKPGLFRKLTSSKPGKFRKLAPPPPPSMDAERGKLVPLRQQHVSDGNGSAD
jgi:hypothetical protein